MSTSDPDSDLWTPSSNYDQDSDLSVPMQNNQSSSNKLSSNYFSKGSDIFRDLLYGWGKAGANVAKLFNKNAPDMPDIRSQNSSPLAVGLGQYAPFAIGGGASLLGSTIGAGTFGATQFEPGQKGVIDKATGIPSNRLTNSIEDSVINAIFHGLLPFGKNKSENITEQSPTNMDINFKPNESTPFNQQVSFPSIDSQFNKIPFNTPDSLSVNPSPSLSENIANELHRNITGGKSFEEAGKELADYIRPAYKNEITKHSKIYNDEILDVPTNNINIHTGEPVKVRETDMYGSNYLENYKNNEFPDENIQLLHDEHVNNPTVDNAHELQKEFGSEIGYLKNQNAKGNLDQLGKNKLRTYVNAQNTLKSDIKSKLNDIDPKLSKKYDDVTQSWKENVVTFEADKDLKDIARGNIRNPTTAQVNSIFKNPEESMNSVISKLPEDAKNKIVHIGMGKDIYENAPKDLLSAEKSLRAKGLSSYISQQDQQLFRNLRNNVEMEKNTQTEFERNQKIIESLQKAHQESQEKSLQYNERSQQSLENARSQSNKMAEEKIRQIQKQHNDNLKELQEQKNNAIKEELEKKKRRVAAIKIGVYGTAADLGLHALGISPEQLIAFYLGKNKKK